MSDYGISESAEEHREKVVTVVNDIDHQRFHFLVAQPRQRLPGNLTVWDRLRARYRQLSTYDKVAVRKLKEMDLIEMIENSTVGPLRFYIFLRSGSKSSNSNLLTASAQSQLWSFYHILRMLVGPRWRASGIMMTN
jgi:hypothetical protein